MDLSFTTVLLISIVVAVYGTELPIKNNLQRQETNPQEIILKHYVEIGLFVFIGISIVVMIVYGIYSCYCKEKNEGEEDNDIDRCCFGKTYVGYDSINDTDT